LTHHGASRATYRLISQSQQRQLLRARRVLPHADAVMHHIDGSGNPIIREDNNGEPA
jgi:hypothetical protein